MRPLVVVSDVHLGHRACSDVAADLARLVTMHPGHEIVLNGDTFNLASDRRGEEPAASVIAALREHPALLDALRAHLANGGALSLIAGNHDQALPLPAVYDALGTLLCPDTNAELRIEPWLLRRGAVHIEHGHLYDPGNAPTHPLAVPTYSTEPIGIKLTRRFVQPYDLWIVFHKQFSGSTSDNLKVMFHRFGARAVLVLLHYGWILARINAETGMSRWLEPERASGSAALPAHAERAGVDSAALQGLLDGRRPPMHFSFRATFWRFGFDGLLAVLAIPAGLLFSAVTRRLGGLVVAAAALAYLVAMHRNFLARAENRMPEDLRAGAALGRRRTGAKMVIMGHTHHEEESDGYINPGAFGDPPRDGRTYVYVDERGRAERRSILSRS